MVATRDNGKAFHGEIHSGKVGSAVVPVTNENVLGNHVDGSPGPVVAGLPFAESSGSSVEQPVSPYHQLPAREGEMVMDGTNLSRI